MIDQDDDLVELRAALLAGLEELAEALLGSPSIRKLRTWRWGSKGSLNLELHGRKRGAWINYETGQGGGPFHLVQHARSCSMADAIDWSRNWAGLPENERRTTAASERSRADAEEAADQTRRRITAARSLWARSTSIAGTVAARYLTDARAIPAPSMGWSDAVRFHAPTCSLILAATDATGAVQAVQRVKLSPEGRKAEGPADRPVKVTNGVMAGAVVRLPGDPTGPLLLAEGPETGLSVWAVTGHETWITLGSMAKAKLPIDRKVVIARDDDAAWSPADRKLREVVKAWQSAGIRVAVATPWPERRGDKSDLNDTLQIAGPDAVRARIATTLDPATPPSNRKPVLEARRIMAAAISGFYDAAAQHDPDGDKPAPVHAVRVDVAVGKSLVHLAGIDDSVRLGGPSCICHSPAEI